MRGIGVAVSVSTSTVRPHGLELLLVADAETLLLVDDDQAEVGELHVGAEQAVRADEDVDLPELQPADDVGLLLGRPEPADDVDGDGEVGHPLAEGAVVLVGQDGRRYEQGDLLAALDDLQRRPHRDLGLAEPDVAAQQAVHRAAEGEVGIDLLDGRQLVGRLDVQELLGELSLELRLAGGSSCRASLGGPPGHGASPRRGRGRPR